MDFTHPYTQFHLMIGLMFTYILPPTGKESVIPIEIAPGISWWYMVISIAGKLLGMNNYQVFLAILSLGPYRVFWYSTHF